MGLLTKKGTGTLKYIFTRELQFCYPDLSLSDLTTAIHRELVDDGYDLVLFYHPLRGGRCAKSMLSLLGKIQSGLQDAGLSDSRSRRKKTYSEVGTSIFANNTVTEQATLQKNKNEVNGGLVESSIGTGGTLAHYIIIQEFTKILRFNKEINITDNIRRVPRIAIVMSDVTDWIENFDDIKGLPEFLQDCRELVGMNQLILCFENLTFGQMQDRLKRASHAHAQIQNYFPELLKCSLVEADNSIVKILSPDIAEIRNYINRLKYLDEWEIEAADIEKIAVLLASVAAEGIGEYSPERGEKPAPCTLADIHTLLSSYQEKNGVKKLSVEILREIFVKNERECGKEQLANMIG